MQISLKNYNADLKKNTDASSTEEAVGSASLWASVCGQISETEYKLNSFHNYFKGD